MKTFAPDIEALEEKVEYLRNQRTETQTYLRNWEDNKNCAVKELENQITHTRIYWNGVRKSYNETIKYNTASIKVLNETIERLKNEQ